MNDKILFPNETIINTEHFNVGQDWEIPIPGFFIVATKREEIRSIADFNEQEAQEFTRLIMRVRKGMDEILNIKDVYLFQNEDTEHGFHLWMFPRFEWMEKFGRKIESVRPIMESAKENMVNKNVFQEVRDMVEKMKKYMGDF